MVCFCFNMCFFVKNQVKLAVLSLSLQDIQNVWSSASPIPNLFLNVLKNYETKNDRQYTTWIRKSCGVPWARSCFNSIQFNKENIKNIRVVVSISPWSFAFVVTWFCLLPHSDTVHFYVLSSILGEFLISSKWAKVGVGEGVLYLNF